ncbi:Patatin-like phospholipase [Cnuella takakiae]|uniref:Patatin-like phospholipase n=1 Tax=Cnuella takakiae TaxID=1302690 RepID=A0A1M5GYR7_9BACT|nr:patatin-like phospholipase family protein [Cnuella takakiae]OLY90841.1 hypothetical protein BUE76_02215 [Cnuella takakiae]SHG08860.1 Patatin-like phospholipase [Cnuella takakiae]
MEYLRGIFYSLPVQLLFLHFRKYQLLLLFWVILFATVSGNFLKSMGADALFLAPEYLGDVNALSAGIMGMSIGVFIMCWNITTFILFSRHVHFLAATQYPFFKYCVNNSVIPISFLVYYLVKAYQFSHYKELISNVEIIFISIGFITGLILTLSISFTYFFGADKTILKRIQPLFKGASDFVSHLQPEQPRKTGSLIHAEWFLTSFNSVRRCRDVSHYSEHMMNTIFKRHHFAAVVSILVAVFFLVTIGFFLESPFFQIPAGASITLLFGILIGASGALAYFFQSWSIPFLAISLVVLNYLYKTDIIDPRNKAYGLSYNNKDAWPTYSRECLDSMASAANRAADRANMEQILWRWKARQGEEKPLLVLIATSGGGNRSATFTMNTLQTLDSLMGDQLMKRTALITGASGGMIGATYFRELYRQKLNGKPINLRDQRYVEHIARDLLNPIFSSFVARDVFAPAQFFSVGENRYIKDRGFAFENKLNQNTDSLLDHRLRDYVQDETQARIPMILFHALINRDARKLVISTQPVRFMMQSPADTLHAPPDAVDFVSFFANQDPYSLRMLTALRMNATFPVVLPSVWLPSQPVIDIMDGGLRDNFGVENSLRFLSAMQQWIQANTRGVLLIQIRDRQPGSWDDPFVLKGFGDHTIKPIMLLQNNWADMMEYFQNDSYTYFALNNGLPIHRVIFQYVSDKKKEKAALSFHLTKSEKQNIRESLHAPVNMQSFEQVKALLQAVKVEEPVKPVE